MPQVNRQPLALGNFLKYQSGGRNPDNLLEGVRPTIDAEQFYAPDRYRVATEAILMDRGQLEFVLVPDQQVWKILNASVQFTLNAGESATWSFRVERIPGQGLNGWPVAASDEINNYHASIAATFQWAWQPTQSFLMTEGQRFVVRLDQETAPASVPGWLSVHYILLQDNA